MNKTLIAASLALGLATSGASQAGGIQIAVEGNGTGPSAFMNVFGNTEGNSLLDGVILGIAGGPTTGGIWRGHNTFDVEAFTGFASEISIDFSMNVDMLTLGGGGAPGLGTTVSVTRTAGSFGTFNVYYDDFGRIDSDIVFGIAGDAGSGLGYTDGVLVASGAMALGGAFTITQLSTTAANPLAVNDPTATITSSGGTTVGVNFELADIDTAYVINDLSGAIIDMSSANSLTTPYDGIINAFPPTRASSTFSGGTVPRNFGADGTNDFTCGAVFGVCDFQSQMNTTLFFVAGEVPEPGTVALLGASLLTMFGVSRRRRRIKK